MAQAAFLIFTAVSAATSIAGGVQAQRNAKAEASFRREVGKIEAADKRRDTRRLIASQQVAFAASGVDPSLGTPLDVLGDTVAEAELAALRLQFTRDSEAASLKLRGSQALTQGITSGLGTILGAAAGFAGLGSAPKKKFKTFSASDDEASFSFDFNNPFGGL